MYDFPALREFLKDQTEYSANIPCRPRQVPPAENQRCALAKCVNFQVREIQVAHRGPIAIALLVMSEHAGVPAYNPARPSESEFGRIPVAFHKSNNISLIPGSLLPCQDSLEGRLWGRASGWW